MEPVAPASSSLSPMKTLGMTFGLIVLRMAGMVLLAVAMPLAHETFGEIYPGDGQQGAGFFIMFCMVGFASSILYMITATIAHFLVMKKSLPVKLWVETAVLLVFVSVLAGLGITAHYN
jgi:hypothetical protein